MQYILAHGFYNYMLHVIFSISAIAIDIDGEMILLNSAHKGIIVVKDLAQVYVQNSGIV